MHQGVWAAVRECSMTGPGSGKVQAEPGEAAAPRPRPGPSLLRALGGH